VSNGNDILTTLESLQEKIFNVIAVDEAFMIENCASVLIDLFKAGYTIIVSSIQLDANFKPFEEIMKMMPYATQIDICPAVCPVTGNDAYYTMAKFNYTGVTVGGDILYEPRSWSAFHILNDRQ